MLTYQCSFIIVVYFIVYFILLWGQELERAQAKVAILEKDLALEVHRREEVCKHHDKVSSNMSPYFTIEEVLLEVGTFLCSSC